MTILAANTFAFPDYLIMIAYFLLMLGIGSYFYKYMVGMRSYFSGNNKIPWWLSGVSFYMSSFSAFGFITYSALAYRYGLSAIFLWTGFTVPAIIVSVIFFAKKWRRMRIDSPVEYLEERYSPAVRQIFAWQGVPVKILDDTLKLVAIGIFVSGIFGLKFEVAMLSSGLIMMAYTMLGGLWAVVITDFIQFVVMMVAILVLIPLSIVRVGGISAFVERAPEGFFSFLNSEYNLIYLGINIILYIFAYSSLNWSLVQRYYCVPKEKDVYKLGIVVVILQITGPALIIFPALLARVFLPDITNDGQVYPQICLELLPAGMMGLVLAAMFSATMSMLSSDYNVCASVLTNDVYRRLVRPGASPKELVLVGRIVTLSIGIIVVGIALLIGNRSGEDLFRFMLQLFGIATAPVAIPMLFGMFMKSITNRAALTGFAGGIITGLIILTLVPSDIEWFGMNWKLESILLLSTTAVTLSLCLAVSFVFPMDEKKSQSVKVFLSKLDIPIGQMEQDRIGDNEITFSPFKIVGTSILLVGLIMLLILPWIWRDGLFAFCLDLIVSVVLFITGAAIYLKAK